MKKPIQLAIICGGQTTEHSISIVSAKNIAAGFDRKKYALYIIYINQQGEWWLIENVEAFIKKTPQALCESGLAEQVTFLFGQPASPLHSVKQPQKKFSIDCFFPILHGPMGEDGTLQGLLELLQRPYVGSGVLGCALSMHKGVTKELLSQHGLPVVPWVEIQHHEMLHVNYHAITSQLGQTLFIKPVHLGSSVGIHKVSDENAFQAGLLDAFRYDEAVLVESAILGRELECAVLGNESPKASLPGEIISHHDFYSYDAKYLDPQGAETVVVAEIDKKTSDLIRGTALKAFQVLRCAGMLRVDFFLQEDGQIFINEVNPLPGFTDISMYPKMWEASDVPYSALLDTLVQLALAQDKKKNNYIKIYQDHSAAA